MRIFMPFSLPFNEDTMEWQYISDRISAGADYASIRYSIVYDRNANQAFFDGLQLYKEEFGQSFGYDENGNLTSTEDLAKKESTFTYNTGNDLIKAADPKGGEFQYTYDGKKNLTKATTAEGTEYRFTLWISFPVPA